MGTLNVTAADLLAIERMLRAGTTVRAVAIHTGRSEAGIRDIRDRLGIPVLVRPPAPDDGTDLPPREVLRPYQEQWLSLLHSATARQLHRMHVAVCRVLGLPSTATGDATAAAAVADRRTADQLAAGYLRALGVA